MSLKTCFSTQYVTHVIKQLLHAFSWVYIKLWMHLESLESIQEAMSYFYTCFVLSKLLVWIHNSMYAR